MWLWNDGCFGYDILIVMDFGLDKILFNLIREHWLIFLFFVFGIVFIRLFFEDILPFLIGRLKDKMRYKQGLKFRDNRDLLKWLQSLHHTEFEKYVAELFRKLGYQAETIGKIGDHGLDIKIEKGGQVSYVQCKRYSGTHKVSEPEVRNFLGSLTHEYVMGTGYFVTTSSFTMEAKQFARGECIELVDGSRLIEYIRVAEKNGFSVKQENERVEKTCPDCRVELVIKEGKFGKFIGCSNYPKCKYTDSLE